MKCLNLAIFIAVLAWSALRLNGQALNTRVLVVYNSTSPESQDVAQYYRSARGIPAANLCSINPSSTVVIPKAEYDSAVKTPIQACLNAAGRRQILYIVMTYGTP